MTYIVEELYSGKTIAIFNTSDELDDWLDNYVDDTGTMADGTKVSVYREYD